MSQPDFFLPIVEQETIGGNSLTERANTAALFETFGHLKPGVTPEQAEADVNRVAAELAKAYPKEFDAKHMVVGRTGLIGLQRGSARVRDGVDGAGRADSAGRLRQPGRTVCGARFGSRARSCAAAGAGVDAEENSAAVVDRGGVDLAGRRDAGSAGRDAAFAQAEHVAAVRGSADPYSGDDGRAHLRRGAGARVVQRIPVRDRAGAAGDAREPLRSGEGRLDEHERGARSRCAMCCWWRRSRFARCW